MSSLSHSQSVPAPAGAIAAASAAAIKPLVSGGYLCYQASKHLPGHGFMTLNVVDEGRSISNEPLVDGKQQYSFNLFSVDSTDVQTLKMDYAEFDALFRFHPDLMNPNRKADRFFYVLQRLDLISSPSTGLQLSIGGAPAGDHCQVPLGSKVQIPIGKLTIQDRLELRRALQGLNAIRDANIQAKKERAHGEFMKIIENNNKEAERKMQLRQEAIHREREQRRLFHLEQRKQEMQREAQIKAVTDKRNFSITNIGRRRKETGNNQTQTLLTSSSAAEATHAQAVAGWKEKRLRAEQAERGAKAEEAVHIERLDASRQTVIDERLQAWDERKAAWLVRFKRDEEKRAKRERVLKEKKQEVLHEIDMQGKKVWDELSSLRRERDEVLRFCRGEDQFGLASTATAGEAALEKLRAPTLAAPAVAEEREDDKGESRRSSIKVSVAPSVLSVAKPAEMRVKRVEEREKRRNAEEAKRAVQQRDKQKRVQLKKHIEKTRKTQEREDQLKQLKIKKQKEEQDRRRKAKLREENIARRQAEKIAAIVGH